MSEIRWTRGWHERAKVEVANGAHLDRDESELALAEIERAWGEIERLTEHLSIANTALEPIERDNERLTAEIERLRAPAPLTKAALGVVSAWDARAKDGQSAPGGMLMIGNAIERLRNEVRIAPAPLTEAAIDAWAGRFTAVMAGAQSPDITARLVGEARRWLDRCAADPLAVIELAEAHVSRGRMLDMRAAPLTEIEDLRRRFRQERAEAAASERATAAIQAAFTAVGFPRQDGEPLTETFARAWTWCVDHAHKAQEAAGRATPASLTEGIDRAALVRWLRAIAAGKIDITPDVESILDAMSAALNRQRRTAPLTEAEAIAWGTRVAQALSHGPTVEALKQAWRREIPTWVRASRGDIPPHVRPETLGT